LRSTCTVAVRMTETNHASPDSYRGRWVCIRPQGTGNAATGGAQLWLAQDEWEICALYVRHQCSFLQRRTAGIVDDPVRAKVDQSDM